MSLRELVRDEATKVKVAREIVGATGIDQVARHALRAATTGSSEPGTGVDDLVPPGSPTGVTVQSFMRRLVVFWDRPPPADYVRTTVVEVTPQGAPAQVTEVRADDLHTLIDAPTGASPVPHSIRVKHRDVWGRESGWFGPVSSTPQQSTVDFLAANRILAGNIVAALNVTAGGKVSAGGARMDGGGMSLTETADQLSAPSVDRGSKITPVGSDPFAAAQFFRVSGVSRGAHLRADGVPGGIAGELRLEATGDGNVAGNKRALLQIRGGADGTRAETFVQIQPHLKVVGDTLLNGALEVAGAVNQTATPFAVDAAGNLSAGTLSGVSISSTQGISAGANISSATNVIAQGELRASGRIVQLGTPFEVTALGSVLAQALDAAGNVVAGGKVSAGTNLEFAGAMDQTGAGVFAVNAAGDVTAQAVGFATLAQSGTGGFSVNAAGRVASGGIAPNYSSASVLVGVGSFQDFSHGLGTADLSVDAEAQIAAGQWRPLGQADTILFVDFVSSTAIRVRNDSPAQQTVRVRATKR